MLSKLVNEHRDDWDTILCYVMCAYRATPHSSTGLSPNMLMLGREAQLPVDLVYGYEAPDQQQCPIEYVEWLRAAMAESFQRCRRELQDAALRQARHYNRLSGDPVYRVGQWVLLFYPPVANLKLGLKFIGPFKVTRKMSDVTYEIESPVTLKKKVVHVDHLKPYLSEVTQDDLSGLPDLPQHNDLEGYFLQPLNASSADEPLEGPQGHMEEVLPDLDIIPEAMRSPDLGFKPLDRRSRSRVPPERYGHNVGHL